MIWTNFHRLGLRGTRSVFAVEEERRALLQLVKGDVRRQQEATSRLRQMPERVVRILHVTLTIFPRRMTDVCRDFRETRIYPLIGYCLDYHPV